MSLLVFEHVTKTHQAAAPGSRAPAAPVCAVNDLSLSLAAGETLALIGESGAGKSTIADLALRLTPPSKGRVLLAGHDLAAARKAELRSLRSTVALLRADAHASLPPRQKLAAAIAEPLEIAKSDLDAAARRARVEAALGLVAIGQALAGAYPHELSASERQRAAIARAIVTQPRLIVLDDPTASLEPAARTAILGLLARLQADFGFAYLFLTGDILAATQLAGGLGVLYLGSLVEAGSTDDVLRSPKHPYTQALLAAPLPLDPREHRQPVPLRGELPAPAARPTGCLLSGRCPLGDESCRQAPARLRPWAPSHDVACFKVLSMDDRAPVPAA
jgi:oligopeptide/dipeptide ABC transporter ATP-binding protein